MPVPDRERAYWESIESDQRAWRYIPFTPFVKLLQTEKLLFRKVSAFSDPYEGSVPKALTEIRRRDAEALDVPPDRFAEAHAEITSHVRDCAYANCWHLNDRESEAMWQRYGSEMVAVVAEPEAFLTAFSAQDRPLLARPVRYFDYFAEFDDLSDDERARLEGIAAEIREEYAAVNFVKRESFRHENEFRVLDVDLSYVSAEADAERADDAVADGERRTYPAFRSGASEPVYLDLREKPSEEKRELRVDLPALIDEVRVAPGAGDWFYRTVRETVEEMGPESLTADLVSRSVADEHDPHR